MKFTVELEVSDGDLDRLESATGVARGKLDKDLPGHAKAAFAEYIEQYLGRRALSRGSDILEHRLHLLIRHAYANQVPTEAQVSGLFQTTPAQSKTLIRNTLSKYRFDLDAALKATIKATLESGTWKKGEVQLSLRSAQVLEALKARLEQFHPAEVPIGRTPDASTWSLKRASYLKLCADFNATAVPE